MADEIHNLTGSHSMIEQKATNITCHQSLLSINGSAMASRQEVSIRSVARNTKKQLTQEKIQNFFSCEGQGLQKETSFFKVW